jgi:4-amino-4-deoxy-L-arabinose transferase-like glycosyltransferase
MTKGPLALVVTLLPLAGVMIVAGGRRRSQIIGLLGMVALAAVVAGPWYVYAADLELNKAVMVWKREWGAKREEFQTPVYYVALLGLIAPWTIWLVAGLVQPFIRARQGARRQLLMAWLWFVTIFVFFSIPGAKQQRYILPIMPATALLVAQVWRFHQLRAEQGQVEQGIDLLRVPHWALLGVVSVGVGPVLLLQGSMVSWGWLTEQPAGPMGWPTVVAGSVVLMGLWWWGMRLHFRWQPLKAAVLTAVWSLVLMTLLWAGYSKSTTGVHPIKKEGQRIAGLVGAQPMYHLLVPQVDDLVNEEFLLYAKRIVPSLSPEQVREMSGQLSEVTYLIAREDERHDSILERSGWQRVTTFNQDYELLNWLWVHEATGEDAAAAEGEGEQRKRETGAAG